MRAAAAAQRDRLPAVSRGEFPGDLASDLCNCRRASTDEGAQESGTSSSSPSPGQDRCAESWTKPQVRHPFRGERARVDGGSSHGRPTSFLRAESGGCVGDGLAVEGESLGARVLGRRFVLGPGRKSFSLLIFRTFLTLRTPTTSGAFRTYGTVREAPTTAKVRSALNPRDRRFPQHGAEAWYSAQASGVRVNCAEGVGAQLDHRRQADVPHGGRCS